jgi:hypothetical protein
MLFPGNVMAAVRLENTANDAMRKMVEFDTIVLTVIEDANQIIEKSNYWRYWPLLLRIIIEFNKQLVISRFIVANTTWLVIPMLVKKRDFIV